MNININIAAIGQLFLGLYLFIIGAVYWFRWEIATWVLPLLAIIAGIIIVVSVLMATFAITKKAE